MVVPAIMTTVIKQSNSSKKKRSTALWSLLLLLALWTTPGQAQRTTTTTACAKRRNTDADCEDGDGRCQLVRDGCQEVNGTQLAGQSCTASLTTDKGGDLIYAQSNTSGCAGGLVCNVMGAPNANVTDVFISGVCESEKCVGKKVPNNCNGNNPKDPSCTSATARVTICHRTCSETNPWVRITIDEDAWNGEGCGHLLQHDIRVECKNKAPWTAWGSNRKDYLIKYHGTRAQVAAQLNDNPAKIQEYWKQWEPACPYVRNGKCCDWSGNLCCGDAPGKIYTPTVDIKKYAGPVGQCSKGNMTGLQDVLYTLPNTTTSWQYCYVVNVTNSSTECLYQMNMTDPAPVGGIPDGTPIQVTSGLDDQMCPGDVRYIPGQIVPGLNATEGPINATVTGQGVQSNKVVEAADPATVTIPDPPPTPRPTPAPVTPTNPPVEPTNPPVTPTLPPVTPTTPPVAPTVPPTAPPTVPKCVLDMGETDETICPGDDVVTVIDIKAQNNRIIPATLDPSKILYDLRFTGSEASPEVSFKVDNPFDFAVDMFVQYHTKVEGSTAGALDPACDGSLMEPACNPRATPIKAGCIKSDVDFTIMSVFFISDNTLFGTGSTAVTPYECCPIPPGHLKKPIIEYTFKILCECPSTSRNLRGS